ncbi:metallophosphoesterase family protein [Alkalispirillum mobile]|nr:metallophosphoesterase [Alkalispirillum mobile]
MSANSSNSEGMGRHELTAPDPSRVLFAGDPHGRFDPIRTAVEAYRPEAVILLGDYELEAPLDETLGPVAEKTQVWWIAGNHDYVQTHYYDHLFGSRLAERNLHGRVVEIAGLRVAGLGGHFQGKIWYPRQGQAEPNFTSRDAFLAQLGKGNRWRGGLPRKRRGAIWYEDVSALGEEQADVLVSHEAPACHHLGFQAIDELAKALGARLIVHGHLHEHYSVPSRAGAPCVFGVGEAEVVDLKGNRLSAE